MSPKKLYSFWMTGAHAAALKAIKRATDVSESEQIRRALDSWIDQNGVHVKTPRKRARTRTRG